jgi:uncharacterized protein YjbJ (UPF0337 family)
VRGAVRVEISCQALSVAVTLAQKLHRAVRATECRRLKVDWKLMRASWQRFRGEVHANWGRLTSPHLDFIGGNRARLASQIEEIYGLTGHEAELQIKSFEARTRTRGP